SASFTYFASVSASEYTTTVRMPISRQARWMRSAISPRLAIRIFSSMLAENEQRLPVLHRLAVFHEHRLHHAGGVGLDLVHQLHRLDDANRLAFLDGLADLDKRFGVGRRRTVKGTDHGGLHDMAFLACLGFGCRRRCRGAGAGRASAAAGGVPRPTVATDAGAILTAPPLTIFTFSSPSVISNSAMPDSW